MQKNNSKETGQCTSHGVIDSFNTLIATVIGGTIGLTMGIVGIFILNCL